MCGKVSSHTGKVVLCFFDILLADGYGHILIDGDSLFIVSTQGNSIFFHWAVSSLSFLKLIWFLGLWAAKSADTIYIQSSDAVLTPNGFGVAISTAVMRLHSKQRMFKR